MGENGLYWAPIICCVGAVMFGFIDIAKVSDVHSLKYYTRFQFIFFVLILFASNCLSTLMVYNIFSEEFVNRKWFGEPWVYAAVIGVVGFEGILKKVNISYLDKVFFNLQIWIAKARDIASVSVLKKNNDDNVFMQERYARQLANNISEQELITICSQWFGSTEYSKLKEEFGNIGNKNFSYYLAYCMANHSTSKSAALLKAHKKVPLRSRDQ